MQAEAERQGIVTASLTLLPEVTRRMRPPRALSVPFPLGYPLGEPEAPELQKAVLRRLLAMIPGEEVPALEELAEGGALAG